MSDLISFLIESFLPYSLQCSLGYHNWINIDKRPMPNPKPGEMICWSELHECKHCKKQEYKGMGCIC